MSKHIPIEELSYSKKIRDWLAQRYGKEQAQTIWQQVIGNDNCYLTEMPDYGGRQNGHASAIYGGMLIFALYPALRDQPPITELAGFVQNLFMEPFTKLGKFLISVVPVICG